MIRWIQTISRGAAGLLAVAILILSFVPPSHRPVTDVSHSMEHFGSFLATGFAFGFGYPSRPLALALALAASCGVIEVVQLWIPGRHARLSDFMLDAAATIIGVGIAYMATRARPMPKIETRS